jgi:hypothetical protein
MMHQHWGNVDLSFICLYMVSQEERSEFWDVIVSVILGKKRICMCPVLNGFQARTVSLYSSLDLVPSIVLPSHQNLEAIPSL